MKKFTAFILVMFTASAAISQAYYNEWIDYSKTYYKFKVGRTGIYRISTTALASIGLGNEPAQNFQLWRNGKQVPVYTSASTGPLGTGGYIEFIGFRNDGVMDKDLYRKPDYQLSNYVSLLTDTASYFLTSNPSGTNLRYVNNNNNVAGNTLPPESYFMYSVRKDFKEQVNRGKAVLVGEYLYSSSYDIGEMMSTQDIYPGTPAQATFNNLFVAPGGPAASLRASIAGSAANTHKYALEVNGTQFDSVILGQFDAEVYSKSNISLALLSTSATVKVVNKTGNPNDRIVCGFTELTYPRQFNFGNDSAFSFTMPASAVNKYIEINNFSTGGTTPVLYDMTNMRRYVADVSGSTYRFVLQPSTQPANFVLVTQLTADIQNVTDFRQRNFVNYTLTANQGDYLIITHPWLQSLYNGADQVEQYRLYRSSFAGGSYNAKTYDIEQLIDQFGYGVKKNPLAIKNFLRYARNRFSVQPKYAFLLGKGMSYSYYREWEFSPLAEQLDLVPTWGYPASDVLLASDNMDPVMNTLISRLSVINPQEIAEYLDKVKQYEQAQQNPSQAIADKLWMKNIVHVVGSNDPGIGPTIAAYMRGYKRTIEDTLFGGNVTTFSNESTGPVNPIVNALMYSLFEQGISLLSYFGHSSATSLDYNLDDPSAYNNTGKYPVFLVAGCNAGNLYTYDVSRFTVRETLSEKYVLAKNKGSIGFIASTHFGIDTYLDYYNQRFYKSLSSTGYGKSVTFNMSEAINNMNATFGTESIYSRMHSEQTTLHGDPALKINSSPKPDFAVEEPQIQIVPNIVSVADNKFTIKTQVYNLGKATGDSVRLKIVHRSPDGTDTTVYNSKIKAIRYEDSATVAVPISFNKKGENTVIVQIDVDNTYDEVSEANNIASKKFIIYEDELTPVYPMNYAIVNKANIKLEASTANPVVSGRQYLMEMDTTALFNSPFKSSQNIVSGGGLIEFDPGITFKDSTVYYWRVAPATSAGNIRWNQASFVYLNGTNVGFNQSHLYQHLQSATNKIYIDSITRQWRFSNNLNTMTLTNSIYPTSGTEDGHFSIAVNGAIVAASACVGSSIMFTVFDPITLKPLYNQAVPATTPNPPLGHFMGSGSSTCASSRNFNFEWSYLDSTGRRQMRDFLDWVPNGYYVTARLNLNDTSFVDQWRSDALVYGANNTLYSRLKNAGFAGLDAFTYPRTWSFIYKKGDPSFQPQYLMSAGVSDRITLNVVINTPNTSGTITSPAFGPAKSWQQVKWRGNSVESNPKDVYSVYVIGIKTSGQQDTLYTLSPGQQDFNISSVSAAQYPYIRLGMKNQDLDSSVLTPYQLRYWRLYYVPIPEGGLAPNLSFNMKDTFEIGDKIDFRIAFKNISEAPFADSILVNTRITDKNGNNYINSFKVKALQPGDTANISFPLDTKSLEGFNTMVVDVNPGFAQPEVSRFNNIMYKNFFVKSDYAKPLLDITFDGVHILNNDIVSAKPKIVIKLKDEAKYLALDDTTLLTVYVQYPNGGTLRRFGYDGDTLRFIPANVASGKNEATIEFSPAFLQDSDGDSYELVVKGKDKSGNAAGNIEYRVRFQVYNKPMISNMFNYPNPFTSSTAFVFTVTGSEVPQNIRIQIMTITGKIVKEITKQELGPLHIGRNITDYKWDGTDQYGQKLANGIYLYRVLTNLNGASLEKFNIKDSFGDRIDTDKYFNKGYGKMYLMR